MKVKLYAHKGGLMDVPVYEGDLPDWYDRAPPATVVLNNRQVFTLADKIDDVTPTYSYLSAASCFVIHTGMIGKV